MNSYFDEEIQREFYYNVGDKVICRNGYSSKFSVDYGQLGTFYPIKGETYTIESVEYCEDGGVLFVSLVEDNDFEAEWCASRFIPNSVFMQG